MQRGTDVTNLWEMYKTQNPRLLPENIQLQLQRVAAAKYGTNPHQAAAVYRAEGDDLSTLLNVRLAKDGKGGLSVTNRSDVARAAGVLTFFDLPSVMVMKHEQASGFATQYAQGDQDLAKTYLAARRTDERSSYGGTVVVNVPLDVPTAKEIGKSFFDVVAAPAFEEGVMGILERKTDLRVIQFSHLYKIPKYVGEGLSAAYEIRTLETGECVVQERHRTAIRSAQDLVTDAFVRHTPEGGSEQRYMVEKDPTPEQLRDMMTAFRINFGTPSNCVLAVKEGITVGIGAGDTERIGAVERMISKGLQKALDRKKRESNKKSNWTPGNMGWKEMLDALGYNPFDGAVVSSDGFFPKRDGIDTLADQGIVAIVQPGGSKADYLIIQAVNERRIAMALTRERFFKH